MGARTEGRRATWIGVLAAISAAVVAGPQAAEAAVPPRPVGVGIVPGPDGTVWFTADRRRIGRVTARGAAGAFRASASGAPYDLVIGPDGNGWYTVPTTERVGRITPPGVATEFPVPDAPNEITTGQDGRLWFTTATAAVGSITTGGAVTMYPTGLMDGTFGRAITSDPDGNIWFVSAEGLGGVDRLNRITPAGVVTLGLIESGDAALGGLAAGSDGNVWLTEPESGRVARITPSGSVTRFRVPGIGFDLTRGPGGHLWFTGGHGVGRVTPSGAVTRFRNGFHDQLGVIAPGPEGLWFTDAGGRLGRVTATGRVSLFPATPRVLSTRQAERGTITVRLRCSAGNITACRGALILGQSGRGGRTAFALAPGSARDVSIVYTPFMQALLAGRRQLEVTLLLRPVTSSLIGGSAYRVTLRG